MRTFYRDYICFTVLLICVALGLTLLASRYIYNTSGEGYGEHIILIDAGHGGEDGGAISVSGLPESQYNLQIAIKLNDLLNLFGYNTFMLRADDIDLHTEGTTIAQRKASDLKQRVKIANQFPNATLISIHQNSFSDSRYHGLQAFYYNKKSKAIAQRVQNAYKEYIAPNNRRLPQRKTGIYLLEHIHCTAVLVECGFLSNYDEEKRLRDSKYQQKLACIIAYSIIESVSYEIS